MACFYELDLTSANIAVVTISTFDGIGDVDIYVKRGLGWPSRQNFDKKSMLSGNDDEVVYVNPTGIVQYSVSKRYCSL